MAIKGHKKGANETMNINVRYLRGEKTYIMNFNPLNPKSDQHLISLYNMYPESHIKVEEMVTREGTF